MTNPTFRSFDVGELAFFWNPRRWPDITARFEEGRPGSSDVRDAIIQVDDEIGGVGFLHWHADRKAWALTDKGKAWVQKLCSPRSIAAERDWVAPPKPAKVRAKPGPKVRIPVEAPPPDLGVGVLLPNPESFDAEIMRDSVERAREVLAQDEAPADFGKGGDAFVEEDELARLVREQQEDREA